MVGLLMLRCSARSSRLVCENPRRANADIAASMINLRFSELACGEFVKTSQRSRFFNISFLSPSVAHVIEEGQEFQRGARPALDPVVEATSARFRNAAQALHAIRHPPRRTPSWSRYADAPPLPQD